MVQIIKILKYFTSILVIVLHKLLIVRVLSTAGKTLFRKIPVVLVVHRALAPPGGRTRRPVTAAVAMVIITLGLLHPVVVVVVGLPAVSPRGKSRSLGTIMDAVVVEVGLLVVLGSVVAPVLLDVVGILLFQVRVRDLVVVVDRVVVRC